MTKLIKQLDFISIILGAGLLLTACSTTNSVSAPINKPYFLGPVQVSSNVPNICAATHMLYAFKVEQNWTAGGSGLTWYGCTAERQANLQPEYMLTYSIIKNDGTGLNVVSTCALIPAGIGPQFSRMDIVVKLTKGTPSCQAILN